MRSRILSVAGILTALFISVAPVSARENFAAEPFTDVPESNVHFEAIDYLRENSVLKGYTDGTFRPEARINRAEFVKLIANPFILDTERLNECLQQEVREGDDTIFFPDVRRDSWYAPEVCLAKVKNLISGYPDGTFKPGEYISFVEASKILISTFALQTETDEANEKWYMPYVNKMSELRAIPTSVSRFDETITRGDMAEMLYRLKTQTTNRPSKTTSQLR